MPGTVRLDLQVDRTRLIQRIMDICADEIGKRTGMRVRAGAAGDMTVTLALNPVVGKESFSIEKPAPDRVRVVGGDERGLLYGVGRMLRAARYGRGMFRPDDWTGISRPQKPVRIIYFASHFHNYYHDAPISEICDYIRDLALYGYNTVAVWFDMHHFKGINDPAAQRMIRRLRRILQAANDVGLGGMLTLLANEAYANSPKALRGQWTAGHDGYFLAPGGHYRVELCPNKPGGSELILKWREEVFKAFAGIKIDYVVLWPYDQGGCTCSKCAPWGCNGFLKIARPVAGLVRRYFPNCRIILSAWYFDKFIAGEWEGLDKAFRSGKPFMDYILADDYGERYPEYPLKHGVPGGVPLLNFPEISMWSMLPWGGFGANPMPTHLQALWSTSAKKLSGGMPYSEGIFEDINKFICSRFYWQADTRATEAVREYASYYFCPRAAANVVQAIAILETNMRNYWHLCECGRSFCRSSSRDHGAARAYRLLCRAEKYLPAHARRSWRWRILKLRAFVDYELFRTHGRPTPKLDAAFEELAHTFHTVAGKAEPFVMPPTRQARLIQSRRHVAALR